MIDELFIKATGAVTKTYKKGDIIVTDGGKIRHFLYLLEGKLRIYNYTEEGKEFLQHNVIPDHFFGESAVLLDKPFPGNVAVCSCLAEILVIPKNNFLDYLISFPLKMLEFTKTIAEKSLLKGNSLKNIVFLNPEERIFNQLLDHKLERNKPDEKILIDLTRKEISNMTGLRVETVIRTVKKMEKENKLCIKNGKIIF